MNVHVHVHVGESSTEDTCTLKRRKKDSPVSRDRYHRMVQWLLGGWSVQVLAERVLVAQNSSLISLSLVLVRKMVMKMLCAIDRY